MSEAKLPKDLGGYQHIVTGPVLLGDIWVCDGKPQVFVSEESFSSAEEANAYGEQMGIRLYRKCAQPGHHQPDVVAKLREAGLKPTGSLNDSEPELPKTQSGHFIPQDDKRRKMAPMARGLLGYFPAALFEIASHSMESDLKHNPGSTEGPTWARSKSSDHADCIVRHLIDAGAKGTPDRIYHLRALAWRACALLQEECEANGALPGVSSR